MKKFILFMGILVAVSNLYAQNISLKVETQEGSITNLDFGSLKVMSLEGNPLDSSSVQIIKLSVTNKSGRQYKVNQRLSGPILNERNFEIGAQNLSFFTFGAKTGTLPIQQLTLVSQEEKVIFVSDVEGRDDSFQTQYNLIAPGNTNAGMYKGNLIYSVSVID